MPLAHTDFREMIASFPGLRALHRAEQAKAVYLRDKRTLPEDLKRLFDGVSVVRLPMEEADDVAHAISVATGEVASVSLGLRGDTLHYVRRSLEMMRDREVTVDWIPRSNVFDGDVLPQLDGFLLDLSAFNRIGVDRENGLVTAGVGALWSAVHEACMSTGWFPPVFPALPMDTYVGDIVRGETILDSFRGGPETCVRNVDFISADATYGESGFDNVPNSAAGYDLNSLLVAAKGHLTIPLSVTLSLMPSAENLTRRTYSMKTLEELVTSLPKVSRVGILPLRVAFQDETATEVIAGKKGVTVNVLLHGTEETLPSQSKALDDALGEGVEVEEGPFEPTYAIAGNRTLSPLAELRLATSDLAPLLEDLSTWQEAQASLVGLAGSLYEGETVSLVPFLAKKAGRGERFDRLVELVELVRKHRGQVRSNQLVQLLTPEDRLENRFNLVRRIKARLDLPLVVNPSGLLWAPK